MSSLLLLSCTTHACYTMLLPQATAPHHPCTMSLDILLSGTTPLLGGVANMAAPTIPTNLPPGLARLLEANA